MNRTAINYIVDVFLGISFLLVFTTGLLKWRGWTEVFESLLGTKFHMPTVIFIHDWSGLLLGLLVLVHLVLHWNWIVCMTRRYLGRSEKEKCD